MSDERQPPYPHRTGEPDIDEQTLRSLEAFEEALRETPDLTPEQWLLGKVPVQLRERLAHLAWLYRAGRPALCTAPAGPPETIGEYRILGILGHGGAGIVYKARQAGLDRLVALKVVVPSALGSGSNFQRFRLEAEAIARLDHPNIVPIHEIGEHAGRLYFSMKLMEGGSLAERMADVGLPRIDRRTRRDEGGKVWSSSELGRRQERIGRQMARVARAVHHAHQRGILHRDMKPANILLDAGGEPHVTDFGLAKRADGDAGLTQSGFIVGTPSYMAPEQARAAKDLGTAADVYSLGAILYELLARRPPFKAATAVDTLLQLLEREPPRPRVLNPLVDRDLETICLKCLEKEPQRRYGSAEALAEDLERWWNGHPIAARRSGAPERLAKWARRRPAVAALSGLVVLLTLAGLALVGGQWRRAEAARAEAGHELYFNRVALADQVWSANDVKRAEALLDECPEHLRHWEWHYLKRRCHPERLALWTPGADVTGIAYSADGRRLAAADAQGTVTVWDATTGDPARVFAGLGVEVKGLAFGAGGECLSSVTADGRIQVRNIATGEQRASVQLLGGVLQSAAFSREGRRLAAVREDESVRVWESASAEELFVTRVPGASIAAMAFSPDGHRVAFAPGQRIGTRDRTGEVRVWDVPTRREVPLAGQRPRVLAGLAFSPDGSRIAASSLSRDNRLPEDGELTVLDLHTGQLILRHRDRLSNLLSSVVFDSRGERVAAGNLDGTIRIWDLAAGQETLTLRLPDAAACLAFGPDGTSIVAAGTAGVVRLLDATGDASVRSLQSGGWAAVWAVTGSSDGSRVAAGCADGTLGIWDSQTTRRVLACRGHTDGILGAVFSPEGRRVATASRDGTARVWDAATGEEQLCLRGHDGIVHCVAWRPDGQCLATGGDDEVVLLWDAATGTRQRALRGHAGKVLGVAWSPDGRLVASASQDATVRVWELRDGGAIRAFAGHEDGVTAVVFSPDGRLLASCTQGGAPWIHLWDTATGGRLRVMRGHRLKVTSIAFSPDGRRLASASDDRTVRLWDPLRGQEVLTLTGHAGGTTGVTFSASGRHLLSASWDRTVRIWDATPLAARDRP